MCTSASADSANDPKVHLEGGGGSPLTQWGQDINHPIYVTIFSSNDFILNWGSFVGSALYIEVVPTAVVDFGIPGVATPQQITSFLAESFTCDFATNIASNCAQFAYAQGFPNNNINTPGVFYFPGAEFIFTGTFTSGEDLGLTISPEPNTLVLLLFGTLGSVVFLLKRRHVLAV